MELALALPLLLLLSLGVVQLVLLQQARLLIEYAAFSAVRTGVVWNGSLPRMRSAAMFATLPLYGRTDTLGALVATQRRQQALDEAIRQRGGGGLVQVDTLNPRHSPELERAARRVNEIAWEELDLDGVGCFAEGETAPDQQRDEVLRAATVLHAQVQVLFELKVPLANAAFFWAWRRLHAAAPDEAQLAALGRGTASLGEPGAPRRRFFLPLTANYRMRMQSNFFRKWVMH